MLDNAYLNKIHARQCLYIISLYPKESFKSNFKTGRKKFSMEQLPIDSHMLLCKEENSIPIN